LAVDAWTCKTRVGVLNFLLGWFKALRSQRLPEMERRGDLLLKHIDGIAAYCDHHVRFGVDESINTTIKAVLRRARGIRDEVMLLLKLKSATAHPIRSARDLMRFLTAQPLYSHRRRPHKCQFPAAANNRAGFGTYQVTMGPPGWFRRTRVVDQPARFERQVCGETGAVPLNISKRTHPIGGAKVGKGAARAKRQMVEAPGDEQPGPPSRYFQHYRPRL
jgi:hypothetical protein